MKNLYHSMEFVSYGVGSSIYFIKEGSVTEKLNSKAGEMVKELGLEKLEFESYKCNQVSFILD